MQLSRNIIDNHYRDKESSEITVKEVVSYQWSSVTTCVIVKRYDASSLTQDSFSLSITTYTEACLIRSIF